LIGPGIACGLSLWDNLWAKYFLVRNVHGANPRYSAVHVRTPDCPTTSENPRDLAELLKYAEFHLIPLLLVIPGRCAAANPEPMNTGLAKLVAGGRAEDGTVRAHGFRVQRDALPRNDS
jgi:hypothetical protein